MWDAALFTTNNLRTAPAQVMDFIDLLRACQIAHSKYQSKISHIACLIIDFALIHSRSFADCHAVKVQCITALACTHTPIFNLFDRTWRTEPQHSCHGAINATGDGSIKGDQISFGRCRGGYECDCSYWQHASHALASAQLLHPW